MSTLFGDDMLERPRRVLADGARWMPGWLTLQQQAWIVARFHEWTQGLVPIRAAKVRGHEMSVKTVCPGLALAPLSVHP
ncbi:MAG: hypothetical protein LKI58_00085 [Actinomyces sp.]|jgi:alkylated DNA repair protein (DNA oxidative demethylase)|nr:hypothetical protein [Actinomyces sp.]MCI1641528.1 hypothetical protein [Actinomyces sp.]MCI1661728.1 hypothetical protein [Actinomyces sp.]MCI1690476.1 hypothetical protein [Actinomyces sp.]MCI1786457.1 hypothetical protein [Actinomyces sp.]MCI1866140.1 hypothetical protein [Actinomyces sp.]